MWGATLGSCHPVGALDFLVKPFQGLTPLAIACRPLRGWNDGGVASHRVSESSERWRTVWRTEPKLAVPWQWVVLVSHVPDYSI